MADKEKKDINPQYGSSSTPKNKRARNQLSPDESDQVRKYQHRDRPKVSIINQSAMAASGKSADLSDEMNKMMIEIINNFKEEMNKRFAQLERKMDSGFKFINDQMEKRMNKLEEENKSLKIKQDEMENRIEAMERREKRNNIVISGLQTDNAIRDSIESLFSEITVRKIEINDAFKIGKNKVLVKMRNFDEKLIVMKNKIKLNNGKAEKIYLDDDLCNKDRQIQFKARQLAKERKNEGQRVKVGFKKVKINDSWHYWNEKTEKFVVETSQNFQ